MTKKLDYNYCKAAPVQEWMGNKWAVVTLLNMADGHCRFADLFRTIPHVSEKMLAATLRLLERDGLVSRTVCNNQPLIVDYALTPLGESFLREIRYVMQWGQEHYDEILRNRARSERQAFSIST